ncbi:MAG: ubiquitin-like protein Pup [Candidatus Saccharimonadales bacterium]
MQKHEKPNTQTAEIEQDDAQLSAAKHAGQAAVEGQLDEDVDSLLDEIDNVLEENAEDFVKSYIQKGGE